MIKSSLSDNNMEKIRQVEKARQSALRKLAARERTEKEILDYLREAGCSTDEASEIIAEFKSWGYIDDEKYCRRYYEYARNKGRASARIARELMQKGISMEMCRQVLEECGEEGHGDRQSALEVGMKMAYGQIELGKTVDQKFLARVGRRLAGLGYDSGTCYYVMNMIKSSSREIERKSEL